MQSFSGKLYIPIAKERLWFSLAAVLGAIAVVLASLWLEHICRLPGNMMTTPPGPWQA